MSQFAILSLLILEAFVVGGLAQPNGKNLFSNYTCMLNFVSGAQNPASSYGDHKRKIFVIVLTL
jgi:hypothetical protein